MIKQRNFGVAEARVGLSVITCLLVALGYVIVHRLGDAPVPAEIDPSRNAQAAPFSTTPAVPPGDPAPSNASDNRYGAASLPSSNPQTVYRPQWLSPQNDSPGISLPTLGIDEPPTQQSDRLDPSLDPLGSEFRSGLMPEANPKR
ncbi:MAG TPA: hypothetical protein VGM76_07835 [Lacipirellulaceae bacterium]|jgi:hypothetical protein